MGSEKITLFNILDAWLFDNRLDEELQLFIQGLGILRNTKVLFRFYIWK